MKEPLAFPAQPPHQKRQIALEELHTVILDAAAKAIALRQGVPPGKSGLFTDELQAVNRELCEEAEAVQALIDWNQWHKEGL